MYRELPLKEDEEEDESPREEESEEGLDLILVRFRQLSVYFERYS